MAAATGILWVDVPASDGSTWLLAVRRERTEALTATHRELLEGVALILGHAIERTILEDTLRAETLHDALTGLPNRALFVDRLQQALQRSEPASPPVVIVLDIDRFGAIGGVLGHEAGDEVLAALAARLRDGVQRGDTLARIIGDQFALFREGPTDVGEAMVLALRLIEAVARPLVVDDVELHLTASAGIVVAGERADAPSLVRDANAALRRSHRRRRGAVEVFDASMREQLVERMQIERDLRRGIKQGELRLVYQPLVSLHDRLVVGVEALVRWAHPAWGLIAPARFLPVAEQSGLIVPLGYWVLREASRQIATWSAAFPGRQVPAMSINVSTTQVSDPGFYAAVAQATGGAGLPPERLTLDVTETVLQDRPPILVALAELKALGVRIVLDDFVTGNASLSWLTRFPLDGLKLDATFVAALATDTKVRSLIEAIGGMARAFDLDVVAEGVETEEQATALEELHCQVAQGYLFGRPVPAGQLEATLASALPRASSRPGASPAQIAPAATVTMREAADALGVSPSTLRRWSDDGRLAAIRTAGGHRRFRIDDVRRLRAGQRSDLPKVRLVEPPDRALPRSAALLRSRADQIVTAGLRATYESPAGGWFAGSEGRPRVDEWIHALITALDSGSYDGVIDDSRTLMRRARLRGASTLERVSFLDRSCAALLRSLSETSDTRDETPSARRLCAALRHRALEEVD